MFGVVRCALTDCELRCGLTDCEQSTVARPPGLPAQLPRRYRTAGQPVWQVADAIFASIGPSAATRNTPDLATQPLNVRMVSCRGPGQHPLRYSSGRGAAPVLQTEQHQPLPVKRRVGL